MKLFLSYGHDHNAILVDRIRNDLITAGHEVWIDTAKIKAGEDWRRSIFDGLADTDWVLGFLSKHSIRDPGVCLDELSIALHNKSGAIATILLDGEAAADPPVTVSHIQWLDMHDWQERIGTDEGEAWYQQKLRDILTLLEDPTVQRFSGEIKELEAQLTPVSQVADIGALIDNFVGRQWLRDMVDQWRGTAKDSRLLWISGGAGTGKSAFSAWLGHMGRVNVIGLNLCSYNKDDRRDAGRVIRTLAFQMASRLPDYRRLTLERLQIQGRLVEDLASKTANALFNFLIVEPLRLAIDGGRSAHRYLIVIDGLDETIVDGRSELTEVLAAEVAKLPPWMAVLVTSRPEEPILRQFAELQPVTIKAEAEENTEDLRIYAKAWLGSGTVPGLLIDRIVAAAEGNFLYLRMLRDAVTAGTMSLDAPEGLPKGLSGLYERWFRHRFPDDEAYERYVPLLEVIVAASHPIPLPWLTKIFGWSKREAPRMLEGLGSLFEQRKEGLAPFHKSLRDWLIDVRTAGPAYVIDEAEGASRLIDALWSEFSCWEVLPSGQETLDEFCIAELPEQVMQLKPAEAKTRLGTAAGWELQKQKLIATAETLEKSYAWQRALSWWRLTAWLAQELGPPAMPEFYYAEGKAGDILRVTGRSDDALAAYTRAADAASRLADLHPENLSLQRQASVYLTKQGDMQLLRGDLSAALDRFHKCLESRHRLVAAEPDHGGWQDDVASAQRKLGDVLLKQGKFEDAMRHYQEAYGISYQLVRAVPEKVDWQFSLYLGASKIGQMLLDQHEMTEAEPYLGAALQAIQQLCAAAPESGPRRHDLWISTTKMAEWAASSGHTEQAGTLFRQAFEIIETLAKSDPGNLFWQNDLATAHDRLGDLLLTEGLAEEALAQFRAALAIAIRIVKFDNSNRLWQFDLAVSHDKLGMVLLRLDRLDEALARFVDASFLYRQLDETETGDIAIRHRFAESYERIGNVLVGQGKAEDAIRYFAEGLDLMQSLVTANPARWEWRRDLAVWHHRFSNLLGKTGDVSEALAQIQRALNIGETLVKQDPGDARFQLDLAAYKESHARLLFGQGEVRLGLSQMMDAHDITEWVASCDAGNTDWQHKLAISHSNLGAAFGMAGEPKRMREHLEEGRSVMAGLALRQPDNLAWQRDLQSLNMQIFGMNS